VSGRVTADNGRGSPLCTLNRMDDGLGTIIPGIMKLFA
jgi:hypothetical protein